MLEELLERLAAVAGSAPVRLVAPALVVAARCLADVDERGTEEQLLARSATLRDGARRAGFADPQHRHDQQLAAHGATFVQELERPARRDHAAGWVEAAALWDRLDRPHDAAYCRLRAAQAAHRDGHGSVASRLLDRAAADAREHVPLSQAIAAARPRR